MSGFNMKHALGNRTQRHASGAYSHVSRSPTLKNICMTDLHHGITHLAEKGTRPRSVKQQQFESAYLFGAVFPTTMMIHVKSLLLMLLPIMLCRLEYIDG